MSTRTAEWLRLMAQMKQTQLRVQERVLAGRPEHPTDVQVGPRINAVAKATCRLLSKGRES